MHNLVTHHCMSIYEGVRCEEWQEVPTVRPASENGLSSLPVHTYQKFASLIGTKLTPCCKQTGTRNYCERDLENSRGIQKSVLGPIFVCLCVSFVKENLI